MNNLFVNKQRYITSGIEEELPLEVQILLWNYIDEFIQNKNKPDYLQVFEINKIYDPISNSTSKYKIIHSQEVPTFTNEYIVSGFDIPEGKIFVIDDGSYATMLWAREY